jgi:hypothetical protein
METISLIGSWLWTGAAGPGGVAGTGGIVGACGWFTGLAAWQLFALIGLPVGLYAAYEGYKTMTYHPPVVAVGPEKARDIRELEVDREKARTSTDPAVRAAAIKAIEDRREVRIAEKPIRGDGYGIFVANNDVFVGQKSVIEDAALATVILWGTDGTRKVKDVAQVKNALQGDRTFPTPAAAMDAYRTLLKSVKRASAAFASHGKIGQFQNVPLRIATDTVEIDTAVLVPDHWYAVNNVDRFLVR